MEKDEEKVLTGLDLARSHPAPEHFIELELNFIFLEIVFNFVSRRSYHGLSFGKISGSRNLPKVKFQNCKGKERLFLKF